MSTTERKFVMRHVIGNIMELELNKEKETASEEHCNLSWYFLIKRVNGSDLKVALCVNKPNGVGVHVETKYKVLSNVGFDMTVEDDHSFASKNVIIGWQCSPLIVYGHIYGFRHSFGIDPDQVTIEVDVRIKKLTGIKKKVLRNFDNADDELSDAVLIVNNQKFYVSKKFLATQSVFLKNAFNDYNGTGKQEVTLNGINPSDLQSLLEVLYGDPAIDDDTADGILKLASKYDIPNVTRKCEEFLTDKSEYTIKEKIQNSMKYNLKDLMNKCLKMLKSVKHIQCHFPGNFNDMDASIAKTLLDNLLRTDNRRYSDPRKSPLDKNTFVLNITDLDITKTSLTEGEQIETEVVEHFNILWSARVRRVDAHRVKLFICAHNPYCVGVETEITAKMFERNGNCKSLTNGNTFDADKRQDIYEWPQILNMDQFSQNKTLTLMFYVKIKKRLPRSFDDSKKELSDIVLILANEKKFYLTKLFLASQSSYFTSLFLGGFKESEMKEISLPHIDPDEFQNFLEVLYGDPSIDDDTIEGVLRLADMYDTQNVTRRCEEFLLEKSRKTMKDKLPLSVTFRLQKLKKDCLNKMKTIHETRHNWPGDLKDMDPSIAKILLLNILAHN